MYTIRGNIPSKSNCYRIVTINGKSKLAKSEALSSLPSPTVDFPKSK